MAIPLNTASGVVYIVGWASGTVSGASLTLTSVQGLRVTNAALPEYGSIEWASNFLNVGAVTNGGTARPLRLLSGSGQVVILAPGGTDAYFVGPTGFTKTSGLTTVSRGVPCIVANARVTAVTNLGSASIATYTLPAADGTFLVSAGALITTSTAHSFSLDVTYTDESNVSRTLVLPAFALAGTALTTGLMTNVTGAGPYHMPALQIRCKASTTITIRTSSGGTFTTVVYNAEGIIQQIA